jgi:hypothetical protein
MVQKHFWEANSSLTKQDIPCLLLNLNIHYSAHKS